MSRRPLDAERRGRRLIVPMLPRARDEEHRAATPLRLFFDLVFVVAVAHAGAALHHALAEGRTGGAVLSYAMVFFAIWWAWMNFTWFASAYDTDDVAYRLVTFVQLSGALILAAGVSRAFEERDFGIVTAGYVVMRLALVTQWLRAARSDPARRAGAHRYAAGVSACQVGWVGLLLVPAPWSLAGFAVLALAELLVPIWAERAAPTSWHPAHIAERYGLFTIIVLGESVLAASLAMQSAIRGGELSPDLIGIIVGGLLILFSLWWLYFDRPARELLAAGSLRHAFAWGYGHMPIFAAAAAVGAGLGVAADHASGHGEVGAFAAGAAVAVPVSIYLLGLWALHPRIRAEGPAGTLMAPAVALLVLLTPLTGSAVLLTGLLAAGLLAVKLAQRARAAAVAV